MRIPWGAGVVSDATKLKETCTGSDVYELIPVVRLSDTFTSLDNFTETDTTGKVNLVTGGVEFDGNNASAQTALRYTTALGRKVTTIKVNTRTAALGIGSIELFLANTATVPSLITTAGQIRILFDLANTIVIYECKAGLAVSTRIGTYAINTDYSFFVDINQSTDAAWASMTLSILGGIYTAKTVLYKNDRLTTELAASWYVGIQRYLSNASGKALCSLFEVAYDYATDSPHVLYTADAGTDKTINGLDFTNLALPSGVSDTNLEFAYYFGVATATPTPSSKMSLTALKALGAISGSYQQLSIWVYQNSNGETQTYGAIVNADDAVTSVGAGASAPEAPVIGERYTLSTKVAINIQPPTGYEYIDIYRDGVLLASAISDPTLYEDSTVSASTAYVYTAKGRNATGTGVASNELTLTTSASGVPIEERIIKGMKELTEGMLISNGYFFNWQTANTQDEAKIETYPAVVKIEGTTEENTDEENSIDSMSYSNMMNVSIHCVGKLATEPTNPKDAIRLVINKMLVDLKKLFGTYYYINDEAETEMIFYKGYEYKDNPARDMFDPIQLITTWKIRYRQKRTNPLVNIL